MLASGIRKDIKPMEEKMNVLVIQLRKIFKGSIEYYNTPNEDSYYVEYCLHGLILRHYISYNLLKEATMTQLIESVQTNIGYKIQEYFYR